MKNQFLFFLLFLCTSFVLKSQCDNAFKLDTVIVGCRGSIIVPGGYVQTGIYVDTFLMNGQCTIRTLDLTLHPQTEDITEELCLPSTDPTAPGTYTTIEFDDNGCQFNRITNVFIEPADEFTSLTLCGGESFTIGGITVSSDTTITFDRFDMGPCPYTSSLAIDFLPVPPDQVTNAEICENDIIIWNGLSLTQPGNYTQLQTDEIGCTFNSILNLTPGTPGTISETLTLCEGEILDYGGFIIDAAGEYNLAYIGSEACTDSINLTVVLMPSEFIQITECSDTEVPGSVIIVEGDNCQITEITFIEPTSDMSTFATICPGDSLEWNGEIYTQPTIVVLNLVDDNGCSYRDMLTLEYASEAECTTSVDNLLETESLSLYPNPAIDLLTVTVQDSKNLNAKIEIYNTQGQLIQQSKLLDSTQSVDISNINSGLYFLKLVEANNRSQTQSFIKL